jgi:ADP-heptose:LPS heptosyltransferase
VYAPVRAHPVYALGLIAGRRWILVHPGASAPSRRYPAEQFARAARSVARATDCALVFTGTAAERPLVESIRATLTSSHTRWRAPSTSPVSPRSWPAHPC